MLALELSLIGKPSRACPQARLLVQCNSRRKNLSWGATKCFSVRHSNIGPHSVLPVQALPLIQTDPHRAFSPYPSPLRSFP